MGERRLADDNAERPELESVRAGGNRAAAVTGVALVAALGVLLWHPWGGAGLPTPTHGHAQATALAVGPGSSTPIAKPPGTQQATSSPPGSQASNFADAVPVVFRSLVDNEWTIVALLTPGSTAGDEPVIPHVQPPAWSTEGPFLVLQQGLGGASTQRRTVAGGPSGVCSVAAPPRDRPAVHLPADRVAYLGLTYPGMSGGATIRAAVLGVSGAQITRVPSPVVLLDGVSPDGRYVLPRSGLGGVVLFSSSRPSPLPTDAYRFEVTLPGSSAPRYLYACVGT